MKKYQLIFLFSIIVSSCLSQNYLTNGQVYNFNVGDVFEIEMGNTYTTSSPPIIYFDSIIAKWYSPHLDTIHYVEITYSDQLPACPYPCTGTIQGPSFDTLVITDLDSVAGFVTMGNECPTKDTLYTDSMNEYCGKRVFEMYPIPTCHDTGFDFNNTTSWDIEGCGGGYLNYTNENGSEYANLIFFRKYDTTCGTETVITGVNSLKMPTVKFVFYPNPASSQIDITYQLPQGQNNALLKLYNPLGQLIMSTTLNAGRGVANGDVLTLPNGIYYYTLSVNGEVEATSKLVVIH